MAKLEDIKSLTLTDVKVSAENEKQIIEATVENIYANDVLQAEYRAETFLNLIARGNDEINSTDRWELVKAGDGKLETWTIKFTCSPVDEHEPK